MLAINQAAEPDCVCWEGFKVEKEGNDVFCKGVKNNRNYPCGTEKPPICTCIEKGSGKEVTLDLGETHCIGEAGKYEDLNCKPEAAWKAWLDKHPQYRLYH